LEVEEEVNSGARTVARQEDSLSLALPNPEHTGRVRGRGVYTGWKEEFNGAKPRRRPRAKVNKDEMESRLAQVRQEVREELSMEYNQKLAELESRMVNQMHQIRQPSEDRPPVSPGIRRSSQASGTEVIGGLDNLKVTTTCS
jgi:hypothetical protein